MDITAESTAIRANYIYASKKRFTTTDFTKKIKNVFMLRFKALLIIVRYYLKINYFSYVKIIKTLIGSISIRMVLSKFSFKKVFLITRRI